MSGRDTLGKRTKHGIEKLTKGGRLMSVSETVDYVIKAVVESPHLLASIQFEVLKLAHKSEELFMGDCTIGCLQLHPQLPGSGERLQTVHKYCC